MNIKIWSKVHDQWLELMSLQFGKEGSIWRVTACDPETDPLEDGWYDFMGADLKQIAITGEINYNTHLIPKDKA